MYWERRTAQRTGHPSSILSWLRETISNRSISCKNKTQKNSGDKRCEFSHFYKVKLDVSYAIQHIFSKAIFQMPIIYLCSLRSWRDSCSRGTFLKLTCTHTSRGSAAKTIQHSHANPDSYAGYYKWGEKIQWLRSRGTPWAHCWAFIKRDKKEPAAYSWSALLYELYSEIFPNLSTFLGC